MFRYEVKTAVKKELIVSILYSITNKYIAYYLKIQTLILDLKEISARDGKSIS